MIKPILPKTNTQELFCHQYWRKALKGATPPSNPNAVYNHTLLTDVNMAVLRRNRDNIMSRFTAQRIIRHSDSEFKQLKPIEKDMTLWRGVSIPSYREDQFYDTFNKASNVKKGDIIHMPEYAYASTERSTANLYAPKGKRGIIYEIEVPKGAKISHSFDYVFPRYSKFECLNVELGEEILNPRKHIKLRYILPDINP